MRAKKKYGQVLEKIQGLRIIYNSFKHIWKKN